MLLMLCMGAAISSATTYRLQRVTAVEDGGLYVFEQCGRVMKNTISSNALETTNVYNTTGLVGNESYVWRLSSATGGYKMYNLKASNYLKTNGSNLSFVSSGDATIWKFSFQDNGTVTISENYNYFLGYKNADEYNYKTYAEGTINAYPYSIIVYKLIPEEDGKTSSNLRFSSKFLKFVKGDSYSLPVLSKSEGYDGEITYSSSNISVATVNETTGSVEIIGLGRTLITATATSTASFDASEAVYTIVVMGGYGTSASPFDVRDFFSGYAKDYGTGYVKGFVAGYYTSKTTMTTDATDDTNIALASTVSGGTVANTIPISINSSQQGSYGLQSNPKLLGHEVLIYGNMGTYNGRVTVNNATSFTVTACPVTITSAKYATYSSTYAMDYSGTGITAYTAELSDGYVVLTPVEDGIIPANKGIILYSEDAGTTPVPVTAESGTVSETGLKISDGTTAVGANIYVLGKKNDKVGFYRWTSASSLSSGRVYLDSASSAHEYLSFVLNDGMTTGIDAVQGEGLKANSEYYNLNGQRVAQPTKGLYIVNGRKVIIK